MMLDKTTLIRPMIIADYDSIYKLWQTTPGMGLNNLDDSREGIARYLTRNPDTCFVAEKDGHIAGVILSGHDGRRGYIHHTAVKVQERKKGVGTALVNAALKALQNEGITKVALVVFAANELGNAFWERLGFTTRDDLNYRNKTLDRNLIRMDT